MFYLDGAAVTKVELISIERVDGLMLTMKAKYALKALVALGRAEGQSVLIADIAEVETIPKKFLELILLELKQHGYLASKKGRGGGYQLIRRPEDVFLGDVLRAIDGPQAPLPCLSRTVYRRCDDCADERTCAIRSVLGDAYEATSRVLDRSTLADLLARKNAALAEARRHA